MCYLFISPFRYCSKVPSLTDGANLGTALSRPSAVPTAAGPTGLFLMAIPDATRSCTDLLRFPAKHSTACSRRWGLQ